MTDPRYARSVAPGIFVAAATFVFQAVVALTHTPSGNSSLTGVVEHLQVVSIVVALVAMAPAAAAIGRQAGAPRATRVTLAGMGLLAALCVSTAVHSGDFGFFPFVAIPANLMWFGGFVALGVVLFRRRVVERRYAIALPVIWVMLLPLSAVGGAFGAALLWLAVTRRLGLLGGDRLGAFAPAGA